MRLGTIALGASALLFVAMAADVMAQAARPSSDDRQAATSAASDQADEARPVIRRSKLRARPYLKSMAGDAGGRAHADAAFAASPSSAAAPGRIGTPPR